MRRRALFIFVAAVLLLLAITAFFGGDIVDSMKGSREPAEKSRSIDADGTFGRETAKDR